MEGRGTDFYPYLDNEGNSTPFYEDVAMHYPSSVVAPGHGVMIMDRPHFGRLSELIAQHGDVHSATLVLQFVTYVFPDGGDPAQQSPIATVDWTYRETRARSSACDVCSSAPSSEYRNIGVVEGVRLPMSQRAELESFSQP